MTTSLIEKLLAGFEEIEHRDPHEVIFSEGDTPRGVYVLRSGSLEVYFGNVVARHPRAAVAGQLLGLSAVVMHHRHEYSAVTRAQCEIGFIERDRFERALAEEPSLWFAVLHILSSDVNVAYDDLRTLAGTRTARTARPARLSRHG